jgi:hypothetical protein
MGDVVMEGAILMPLLYLAFLSCNLCYTLLPKSQKGCNSRIVFSQTLLSLTKFV